MEELVPCIGDYKRTVYDLQWNQQLEVRLSRPSAAFFVRYSVGGNTQGRQNITLITRTSLGHFMTKIAGEDNMFVIPEDKSKVLTTLNGLTTRIVVYVLGQEGSIEYFDNVK